MQVDQVAPVGTQGPIRQHLAPAPFAAWTQPAPGLLARLAARYFEGWKWYAANGYLPPAAEAGFPLARARAVGGGARRLPSCVPRFALLFPHTAGTR
jgi:hypothetical protein